jgi:GPI mannosyltransferase 3
VIALRDSKVQLALIVVVAFALRLVAFAFHPGLHPDEVYQYVDPAAFHLRGVGWQSWEWRDGARSWVLPGYHGAWLVVADWIGVPRGVTQFYFLQIHWAFISSVAWVGLGWWGASCVGLLIERRHSGLATMTAPTSSAAALIGAVSLAVYPPLLPYGPRTLTEVPSAIFLILSLVATAQLLVGSKRPWAWALLIGVSASAGVCLRVVNGPLALVPLAWLLSQRKWKSCVVVCLGALVPLIFFGAVDWATWGKPFSSYVTYIKFNFIDGKAADYGVAPATWYAEMLWQRAGVGLVAIVLVALCGWRATWAFLVAGVGLVGYLSSQPHKEERFMMFFWPALLIPAAAVVGTWLARGKAGRRRLLLSAAVLGGLLMSFLGFKGIAQLDWNTGADRIMKAQQYVSTKRDVTGFLFDEHWESAAYGGFAYDVPMLRYRRELLANRLFNYVVVASPSGVAEAETAGFKVLTRWDDVVALGR